MATKDKQNAPLVTLKEVAAHAGVSLSTASRALSNPGRVTPKLIEKVRRAAAELNYQPNELARNLRTSKTMTLGMVFHSLDSPVALEVLLAADATAREHGYTLIVSNAGRQSEDHGRLVDLMMQRRVDGIVSYRPHGTAEAVERATRAGIPIVGVLAARRDAGPIPIVVQSQEVALYALFRRLQALGHRLVAYLEDSHDDRAVLLAELGATFGVEVRVIPVAEPMERIEVLGALQSLFEPGPQPTCIVTRHHFIPWLLLGLRGLHLDVPGDVSIVSWADSEWLGVVQPSVSTMAIDGTALGRRSIESLLDAINGEVLPERTVVGNQVWIERGSVGPAPAHRE